MVTRRTRRKFLVSNFAETGSLVIDPQITEEAYELLSRGAPQKDLLTAITPTSAALHAARPAPPLHKFKLRGPLKDHVSELDAFLAAGFAAGRTLPDMMAEVLPSIDDERAAKAARIKESNERATAKRMARIAAQNDPEKRAREAAAYKARMAAIEAKKVRRREIADERAEKRRQALAENPTLAWRHPRRKDWAKKNLQDAK